ncbi:unnamed protein product [Adineta steineri]|uniref:Uncharacterized protein n=1 Tax=Adineta steineri TaxID=433720 RepID=A0A815UXR0_9BILA|nr:unnamed protein product [Adineta steineri]
MTDNEHHQNFIEQMDEIENNRNLFPEKFIQHKQNLEEHPLIKQMDQWENDSIIKIKQTAEEYTKWKEFGINIAERNELNQLQSPSSILIDDDDDDKTIYIVDSQNDRIIK